MLYALLLFLAITIRYVTLLPGLPYVAYDNQTATTLVNLTNHHQLHKRDEFDQIEHRTQPDSESSVHTKTFYDLSHCSVISLSWLLFNSFTRKSK